MSIRLKLRFDPSPDTSGRLGQTRSTPNATPLSAQAGR